TQTPYSKFLIKQYLENAHQDIFEAKQLRLAICLHNSHNAIGLIDLFDYNPTNNRAGVGIVIHQKQYRQLGIGSEALQLLIQYSFSHLSLHQLYANIGTQNKNSITLFTKFGFQLVGIKKQWNYINGFYHDEALYQLINSK
ncbi:MAG TPA: GNAT family N-acetyltransferase, partial [Flavobacterium sp.]|nr:GNAT family N-acetyltransferase [Flavobacterium sp.]